MLTVLLLIALVFFLICYKFYGGFLARVFKLDNANKTPAETMYDGVDYCPTHPAILIGHHFSSIAGAGPIVGPITAAAWFGWLPAYLWCLLGSAFFGGPHDAGSVIASIRHQGKSVGEVVKVWIGVRGRLLFSWFVVLTLILIVAVFIQLGAGSLAADPAVAFAATVYMVLAFIFGICIYRFKMSVRLGTLIMLPFVFGACWFGQAYPVFSDPFRMSMETWRFILMGYVVLASLLPVWLLLQPRDYLSSYFLYFAVVIGGIGMVFGSFLGSNFEVQLPAFKGLVQGDTNFIWPILFVTVACGAISGFHSMVGSGTTSKQLRKETDSILIGYGSMLLEGMVAVIAIGAVMISGNVASGGPVVTFAEGFGKFGSLVGIDPLLGTSMGALAVNTFILTTVDTATRLTRYQIQELSNYKIDKYLATFIAVAGASVFLFVKTGDRPTWAVIWPVFGAANQLVASLALLAVAVWVKKAFARSNAFLMAPMWFMMVTTIAALGLLVYGELVAAQSNFVVVVFSVVLIILAILMLREALAALANRTESGVGLKGRPKSETA
ncbi:MAG: carbon starvation protein A [Candidatus Adiutrix sp.]|jgi:carbon starvation protein|nr:carbon starvation protein A [Candidatus Adiutrix sp.]